MATEHMPSARAETRKGYWRRTLRPLLWWGILVMVLFAVHQHQLAMERTRIYFSVTMQETNFLNDAVAMLDGREIESGEKISLGSHRLAVTQPKAESFSTNFVVWYGRHDFGRINLKRATGTLKVKAEPVAKTIIVTGPEFAMTLNESTGTNLLVLTDTYHVSARFSHWSAERDYQVTAGNTVSCVFAPKLGAISVTCNENLATYELQDSSGNVVEKGEVPAVVTELPSGRYILVVTYHDHARKKTIVVAANETNEVPFHFAFGAARFESTPPGAQVYTTNGTFLGITPVVVKELPPSTADYRLQLNGYDAATVSVTVAEDQTNAESVTLVSLSYLGSMRTAKQDIAAGHYRNALNSVEQALVAKPGDADALTLQATAKVREMVEEAKNLANRDDYGAAGKKLQAALEILPDDAEVTNLQAGYHARKAEQQKLDADRQKADLERQHADAEAKERAEQSKRPHDYFVKLMADTPNSADFVEQELKVNGDAGDLKTKIADALTKGVLLKFTIEQNEEPFPGGFFILGKLSTMDGFRRCYIVGGQTADGEVTILFKVLEYTWPPDLALPALLKRPGDDMAIPIGQSNLSPSAKETRRTLGIRIVKERIGRAIMDSARN